MRITNERFDALCVGLLFGECRAASRQSFARYSALRFRGQDLFERAYRAVKAAVSEVLLRRRDQLGALSDNAFELIEPGHFSGKLLLKRKDAVSCKRNQLESVDPTLPKHGIGVTQLRR